MRNTLLCPALSLIPAKRDKLYQCHELGTGKNRAEASSHRQTLPGQCTDSTCTARVGTLPRRLSIIKNVIIWTITYFDSMTYFKTFSFHVVIFFIPLFSLILPFIAGSWVYWVCSSTYRTIEVSPSLILSYITMKGHLRWRNKWIVDFEGLLADSENRWEWTENYPSVLIKIFFFNCSI